VLVCALLATVGLLLTIAASASALSQRGHVLANTFGTEGSGAGELKDPQGVAVNEQTGDIYVVDAGNARVDRFDAEGKFISAWGIGVSGEEHNFGICTTTCHPGQAARGKGNLFNARDIAVDNSTSESDPSRGDVYVEVMPFEIEEGGKEVEREGAIEKFTAGGELLAKGSQITHFKEAAGFTEEIEEPFGIFVGPAGNLYLYDEEYVAKFSNGIPNKPESAVEAEFEGSEAHGVAVDPQHDLYLGSEFPSGAPPVISEHQPDGEPLLDTIYDKPTTSIALESSAQGDFVLGNETSVAVLASDKRFVQTLGEGQLTKSAGVAVNAASGHIYAADAATAKIVDFGLEGAGEPTFGASTATNTTPTSAELTARINPHGGENAKYTFRISTATVPGPGDPCTSPCFEAPSPPAALGSSGFDEVTTAPQNVEGLSPETKYQYRVWAQTTVEGATQTAESAEHAFTTPFESGSTLPDGRAYEQVSPPNKNGSALQPKPAEGGVIQAATDGSALTYLGAGAISNTEGNEEPEGNHGPNLTQIVGRWGPSGWSAHDIDVKHDKGEGLTPGSGNNYQMFSPDLGSSVLESFGSESMERPPLDGEASQERTPYLRSQAAECLQSPAPPSCFEPLVSKANTTETFGTKIKFAGSSPDLQHVVLESAVALTSQAVPSSKNLYERLAGAPGALELVSVLPSGLPASFAALGYQQGKIRMNQNAVSTDGTRVIFSTYANANGESPVHLYLRDTALGKTAQVDLQEAGTTVPASVFPGLPASYEHPFYQGATPDGSTIFFTDEWRLTKDSTSRPGSKDLYACRIVLTAGEPECKLTDLTVDSAAQAGDVQGILGTGSNAAGTSIYYVANGRLAPNANSAKCQGGEGWGAKEAQELEEGVELEAKQLNTVCNLYVQHFNAESETWTVPKVVAILSEEDEPDWLTSRQTRSGIRGYLGSITSRVSPDGERLAFMSDRNLTGYEPRDPATGRGVEEVYSYDNATAEVVCASCSPGGAAPQSVFDQEAAGEGIGLLVDRPQLWQDRRLSGSIPGWTNWELSNAYYQARYLNDQGRLFFTSVEALVPQDKNGKEDVYEYEPLGLGGCTTVAETFHPDRGGCVSLITSGTSTHESALLDASESGDDVFLLTAAPLVEQDKDTSFDVYDAAICGREGLRACVEPPAATKPICEEIKTCRPEGEEGEGAAGSALTPPATSASQPNGNTGKHEVLASKEEVKPTTKPTTKPLTRAQKLAKALKVCKKLKQHRKRVACERTARKKYGSVGHKSSHHQIAGRGR
jgi:DNA-binding beta-propeller fold protein YncE